MLHILWILIKFILILLGVLLGLVLLAVLLVLFCPVRYRAEAVKETEELKEIQAKASVSWLFHGIWFRVWFRDGKLSHDLRIFGIPAQKMLRFLKKIKKNSKGKADPSETENQTENEKKAPEEKIEELTEGSVQKAEQKPEEATVPEEPEKESISVKTENKIRFISEKLKKIPEMFRKIKLTIQNIYDKIEWWKAFLSHPKVKAAISCVKDDLLRLLRHIFPTKIGGKITFGSEDPSTTGTVLAVLGITMPFHKNRIAVTPVFDGTDILTGNVALKGRIYGVVILKTALEVYLNKNVKYIIYRWKHKED